MWKARSFDFIFQRKRLYLDLEHDTLAQFFDLRCEQHCRYMVCSELTSWFCPLMTIIDGGIIHTNFSDSTSFLASQILHY